MTKISQWVTTMASTTPGSAVSLVGQGSFLDKTSLHMVGYMGKSPHNISAPHDAWCPVCKTKGQTQALKTYRINFTQSIFLCTNPQCIYPLGYTPLDNIIANTADLKNSSPNKKRKFSDLSSDSLLCKKKPKLDLSILGNSPTVVADPCKSVQTLEHETNLSTSSQDGQTESAGSQVQTVSVTANPSCSSALWDNSSFPELPKEFSNGWTPGQPNGLSAVEDGHQEILQKGDLEVMDTLNNGSVLPPETCLIETEVEKMQEEIRISEMKTTESNVLTFSPDHIQSNGSPLLQNSQSGIILKENCSMDVSVLSNPSDTASDMESELPQSCEFIKDDHCLIEHPKEQKEKMEDEGDEEAASCNTKASLLIQPSPIAISGNPASPERHHEESHQQINFSSLLEISPPTCPEIPVQGNSFGSPDLSESLRLLQEACKMTAASQSQEDVLQKCPTEEGAFIDLVKTVSSLQCPMEEDSEKSSQSASPARESETLFKDLATPMDLTSLTPDGSVVVTEDLSMPVPKLPLVQNCQNTDPEEHSPSHFSQEVLPETQDEEPTLKNPCDGSTASEPSLKDQAAADVAAISLPDTTLTSQITDMASPADNQPVCQPDNGSLDKVCEPHDTSACMRDDCNAHTDTKPLNQMSLPGPKILLQDCLKCHCGMNLQNLCKKPCNDSPLSVPSVEDQAPADAAAIALPHGASTSNMTDDGSAHREDKSPNKMSPTCPQILLKDCLKCHCGMNISYQSSQKTPVKNPASEVGGSLNGVRAITFCENAPAQSDSQKDSNTVSEIEDTTAAPPLHCKQPLSRQKKTSSENTILPDLLLDIQPQHRMEESLSAAPSPAYDAAVTMTLPADVHITKHDMCQNGQVKEGDGILEKEPTEVSRDNSQDDSIVETALNSDGLADSSDEVEERNEDPVEVAPAAKNLRIPERRLQWRNRHSLCWLDCILSALVQSETISHFVAVRRHISKESVICNLFARYDEATTLYMNCIKKRRSELKRPKYDKCLNEVRMEIFEKLKPLLKCHLGKKESPVFAFPLLLKLDPETEKLFMFSFLWQFKCENCGYSYKHKYEKLLITFPKVLPEWHPLNAVHTGPCNRCKSTEQKRAMVLETLNSMFMVHFVDGLPSTDLSKYSFQFKGHSYEVKTIIKYKNKHFSTWISNKDGTWLESDDLRGSFCRRYQKFSVRADDIHIVIWERSEGKTFVEHEPMDVAEQDIELMSENISLNSENSFSTVGATELSQEVAPTVPSVTLDTSDPLAGMEGYAENDVITLTLVEIPLDGNGHPIETPTEFQPAHTSTSLQKENQGNEPHTAELEMSANSQPEGQEHCTLRSPVSSDSNAETVPLKNCSVTLSPFKQSSFKPVPEAIATSTPAQPSCSTKRRMPHNWMTQLLKKDYYKFKSNSFAANNINRMQKTCPPQKVTDLSDAPRKADNFSGFNGRSFSKPSSVFPSNVTDKPSFSVPNEKAAPVVKPPPTQEASGFRTPGSSGLDCGKQLSKEGCSPTEDRIQKLRLKLLKKLKAKRNELTMLEVLSKKQQSGSVGGQANGAPQGGFNRKEHLRDFLQELQEQIDNADNESVCTMSSNTSICSSPGDAEFFAELFSPSPVNNQPHDSKYLEMLADGCGLTAADPKQQTNGHQGDGGVLLSTSGSNSGPTTGSLHSTSDESLNLMSNSTLTALNEDNDYFDFSDYF
ncbi:SUMO-specific isopeptidase USPL1 isoform 1-T2 [Leptodactylus fuscus]|uniref:SUMO-specific isopeptidase USPL1 n=1 Tax=Leptodactylus fuscus TaxID=238119 RepID=UPI003F4E7BB6